MNHQKNVHSKYYEFDCGCKIPIINGFAQIDFENLNLSCAKTWNIYKEGQTQSIFQLEKYLGKKYSKELKPESIEDAAALIAVIRPGTLQAEDENGNSLTDVFCKRKNINWKPSSNILDKLLEKTFGINIYQETSMAISKEVAGFDGPQQMRLIKGIGKKKADILMGLRKEFVGGCIKTNIVNSEEANSIFDNIEASARYAFNKSHSIGYAVAGYWTAWVKAHLPYHYICAWLRNAKNEQKPLEEIRAVISEARRLKINVAPPSITNLPTTNFFIHKNIVYFGLDSIKGCGSKGLEKLLELDINFEDLTWLDFLVMYSDRTNKTQIINMIRCGCFDYTQSARTKCEFEYNQWILLSKKDKEKAKAIYNEHTPLELSSLIELLKEQTSAKRKILMESIILSLTDPPISLNDTINNIVDHEKELMGINVSCSKIQKADIPQTKDSCGSISKSEQKTYVLVGEISEFREIKIKNGKMAGQIMASFLLSDENGCCECVIFPKELNYYQGGMYDGNIIMVEATKSNRGNGIIINKVYEV